MEGLGHVLLCEVCSSPFSSQCVLNFGLYTNFECRSFSYFSSESIYAIKPHSAT
jgi:hypothetical protein